MNNVADGSGPPQPPSLAAPPTVNRLRASNLLLALARGPGKRLSFAQVIDGLGDRTFGFVLLVLAIINVLPQPPGGSTVFGLALTLVGLQFLIGLEQPWVPGCLRRRSIARATFRSGLKRVVPTLRRVERLCQPRLSWLTTGLCERLAGVAIVIFAIIIALPIPVIGNVLPGIAVAIIAIGLIERDGLALLAGVGLGIAAIALIAGLFGAAALALI